MIDFFEEERRKTQVEIIQSDNLFDKFQFMYCFLIDMRDFLRCNIDKMCSLKTNNCLGYYFLRVLLSKMENFRLSVLAPRIVKNMENNYHQYPLAMERIEELNIDDYFISTGENVFVLYDEILNEIRNILMNVNFHNCKSCNIDIIERNFIKEFE